MLERVLPVIFDVEGESNAFEMELLWKRDEVEDDEDMNSNVEGREVSQFVIEDEEDSDRETQSSPPTPGHRQPKGKKRLPSLGHRLFNCIFDLLFCCGFTLPTKFQIDHHKIHYVIWCVLNDYCLGESHRLCREKGVGSTIDPGSSHTYDSNRIEVLRLLLVLLSRQIYVPPGSLLTKPSFYSLHLVQKTSRRGVLTLLCSLLNVAMNSATNSDTGIGSMAGKLPYNHLVFKGEDSRTNLVGMCLQILCVLLDFQSGPARDSITGSGDAQVISPTAKTNTFRYFLMKLVRFSAPSYLSLSQFLDSIGRKTSILSLMGLSVSLNSKWLPSTMFSPAHGRPYLMSMKQVSPIILTETNIDESQSFFAGRFST